MFLTELSLCMPQGGLINRDRKSSAIRPLLYLQATTAGKLSHPHICYLQEVNQTEEELLNNPMSVFFGALLETQLKFKSIPCKVSVASGSLRKVSMSFIELGVNRPFSMPSSVLHYFVG